MAQNYTTTLGGGWEARFLAAAKLLHRLMGNPASGAVKPRAGIGSSPEVLVRLLQDVLSGTYRAERYFERGAEAPAVSAAPHAPEIQDGAEYTLVGLNASTPAGQFVSVEEGGVAFEDPVWMVLAAHALAAGGKPQVAVPLAKSDDALWANAVAAEAAVMDGSYRRENYLGPIAGFLPADARARFELIKAKSANVAGLRQRGMQSFDDGRGKLRFYQLYARPATKAGH